MRDGWVADTLRAGGGGVRDATTSNETRFYFRQGIYTHHPDFQSEADITTERLAPHLIMGTPSSASSSSSATTRSSASTTSRCASAWSRGRRSRRPREQIRRFGEEVVQPIHKKYPAPDHPAIPAVCRW